MDTLAPARPGAAAPHDTDDIAPVPLTKRRPWRSPPDQPSWARPALLAIAVVAAVAYGYGMGSTTLEPFYGGAARSMSESWRNFFFGAADPWGTISVDKLPGALWVQALSLRLFGFHLWAIVLPQVLEGVLTVLVLFRAVRRVAGVGAGLVAATVLAISPVTVLLNRGNISDSLLILLLVLAADSATRAFVEGRMWSLVMAGVWVGLAFQAKMIQAWIILPALYLAYLIAAPSRGFLRRCGHVLLSVLAVALVSLSYMSVVAVIPTHDRPYVDGSCSDSIYSQVFVYNGIDRFNATAVRQTGCSKPSEFLIVASETSTYLGLGTFSVPTGWDRLLQGDFGRDDGWMVFPAIVAALGLFWGRRRRSRLDPIRAATILWTSWLVFTGAFFSSGRYLNSYYTAALIPAVAALCGMGAWLAWRHRHNAITRIVVAVVVAGSTAYGIYLLPGYVGMRIPIMVTTIGVAALAVLILLASLRSRHATTWTISVGLSLSAAALLISSAWATSTSLATGEGPFDTPYQPPIVTYFSQTLPNKERSTWPALIRYADYFPKNQAADVIETSGDTGYDIMVTGHEFLPIGGFSGEMPSPTIAQFKRYIAEGKVLRVQAALRPLSRNPVMIWVTRHCQKLTGKDSTFLLHGSLIQRYNCINVVSVKVHQPS